jgi:hypothetical protein
VMDRYLIAGIKSIAIDTKEKTITVIGKADPLFLAKKLRKFGFPELLSVVPAVEEKKNAEEEKKKEKEKKAESPTVVYMNPSNNSYGTYQGYPYQGYPYNVGRDDYNLSSCTIS